MNITTRRHSDVPSGFPAKENTAAKTKIVCFLLYTLYIWIQKWLYGGSVEISEIYEVSVGLFLVPDVHII
jgi:EamA domain-containing membrane protein RarD